MAYRIEPNPNGNRVPRYVATAIGFLNAALTYIIIHPPPQAPWWVEYLAGVLVAGFSVFGATTHPGLTVKKNGNGDSSKK